MCLLPYGRYSHFSRCSFTQKSVLLSYSYPGPLKVKPCRCAVCVMALTTMYVLYATNTYTDQLSLYSIRLWICASYTGRVCAHSCGTRNTNAYTHAIHHHAPARMRVARARPCTRATRWARMQHVRAQPRVEVHRVEMRAARLSTRRVMGV